MTKKIGDKKIGAVKSSSVGSTSETSQVKGAEQVRGIGKVQATSGVGSVKGAGAIGKRRPTRVMTLAEREQFFKMIDEEAEQLVASGAIPAAKRELVKSAVKMAVESGLVEEDPVPTKSQKQR